MTYEQEEHERDLYEEARAEQQHAVAYSERENANLHRTVERLTAALEAGCEYHHLPLINGWAHKLPSIGKTVRCRLSEKARQALGGE